MKWNHFFIIAVLLLLIGLAGMMAFNTVIGRQQRVIMAQQAETDRLTAELYWMRIAALPPAYSLPLESYWITSGTGYRTNPMGGTDESMHKGVDLVAAENAPVRAALPGTVTEHWLTPGMHSGRMYYGHTIYGAMVVLDHGDGLFNIYAHLSATYVHEGNWVEAGQMIGRVGDTGVCTGPHLHWEFVVDPIKYLEER